MVEEQLIPRGIRNARVLDIMRSLPRHCFVEPTLQNQAYDDNALPIGEGQTISQPYIVALMTEGLALLGKEQVLEIGTGSGYQTAILSRLSARVYTVERLKGLFEKAQHRLAGLACDNVTFRLSDGTLGWKEAAPFDAILVAAGGPKVPQALVDQLKEGGRMVIPVGTRRSQVLKRIVKSKTGLEETALTACAFVPLLGDLGWDEEEGKAALQERPC